MSLIDATFEYGTRGYGTDGFTFSVLGDLLPDGSAYLARGQGDDNVFMADYDGNPFVPYVEYKFIGQHPDIANDPVLVRYTFDANGKGIPSSPLEDPTNAPGATTNTSADTLDEVTGRSSDYSAITTADFFTAWLPQEAGNFLLRKIATASVWLLLINAITEVIADALKGKLPYALDDLTDLFTARDITINGADGNDTVLTDGGIRINEPSGLQTYLGRLQDGAIAFINRAGYKLQLLGSVFSTDATAIDAPNADTVIRTLALRDPQPATEPGNILIAQPSPTPDQKDVKERTLQDFVKDIQPLFDIQDLADKIKELADGKEIPGDARLPDAFLCYDPIEPVLLTQDFVITPEKINTSQSHPLNIDGALIFSRLIGTDKKEATNYTVSFPDTTHYLITPDSGASTDFYGLLNLRTALT